jgi:hypothetical protein
MKTLCNFACSALFLLTALCAFPAHASPPTKAAQHFFIHSTKTHTSEIIDASLTGGTMQYVQATDGIVPDVVTTPALSFLQFNAASHARAYTFPAAEVLACTGDSTALRQCASPASVSHYYNVAQTLPFTVYLRWQPGPKPDYGNV